MTVGRRAAWLVVPLLVACGSGADGQPSVAPDVVLDAPESLDGTAPETLALPLTSLYLTTEGDQRLRQAAIDLATADCMADRGFEFPTDAPDWPPEPADRPFGPWDADDIADGYGAAVGETVESPLERFVASLPEPQAVSWMEAYRGSGDLDGPPITVTLPDGSEVESGFSTSLEDGCYFAGMNAVMGDYAQRDVLRREIERLVNEAAVEAEHRSDLVRQALEVWAECMEAEGIDVADGGDGPDELVSEFVGEPGVSDRERTVGAIDVACKAEANLHDAYFVARAEAEADLIDDNLVFVEAWRELQDEAMAEAREIVARGEG